MKKDYNASADTINLIPIAALHGSSRKAKWWSPILLAVRNPTTGSLEAVTKCVSGFTDKFYIVNKEQNNEDTEENLILRPSYVEYPGRSDIWFKPQEVWEMVFAYITKSPVYLAALRLVNEDRMLSMRFPRFLKTRGDKSIDEASTADFLVKLWFKQEAKGKTKAVDQGDLIEEDDVK